jgi:hypothetical protein
LVAVPDINTALLVAYIVSIQHRQGHMEGLVAHIVDKELDELLEFAVA